MAEAFNKAELLSKPNPISRFLSCAVSTEPCLQKEKGWVKACIVIGINGIEAVFASSRNKGKDGTGDEGTF